MSHARVYRQGAIAPPLFKIIDFKKGRSILLLLLLQLQINVHGDELEVCPWSLVD